MDLGIQGRNALVCAASKGLGKGCALSLAREGASQPFEPFWEARKNAIPAGRFGDPAEFGELCAFICGAQAAFITGQNFLIDGGAYPGTY